MRFKQKLIITLATLTALFFAATFIANLANDSGGEEVTDTPQLESFRGIVVPTEPNAIGAVTENDAQSATPLLQHADTVPVTDDGLYRNTAANDTYSINYYQPNGSIVILLYQEPLGVSRLIAEQQLKSIFGYTEPELCRLHIQVFTNEHVNPFYSRDNLGLSFCPNSVSFE